MKKVLLVINRVEDQGGAEVSTVALLRALQGDEVTFGVVILFGPPKSRWINELKHAGVTFHEAPRGFLRRIRFIDRVVRDWEPDLIHATLFDADIPARVVGVRRRIPVLSSLVNTEYSTAARSASPSPRKLELARIINLITARLAVTHFHSISAAVTQHAETRLRIDARRITCVPRGRDPQALRRRGERDRLEIRRDLGVGTGQTLVLNIGRQEPQKGQRDLVAAFARLRSKVPDAVLLIAGREGSATESIHSQVEQLGLRESVRFLGVRGDVGDLLAACDLFAFPSLWEGLGGALIEALALEAPIVSYDVPAVREVLGGCGVLVEPGDIEALSDAMAATASSTSRESSRVLAGRRRFEQVYTVSAMSAGMKALYLRVSEMPPPPTCERHT